jgi:hypothetical protein
VYTNDYDILNLLSAMLASSARSFVLCFTFRFIYHLRIMSPLLRTTHTTYTTTFFILG